jgi:outer membrane protein TolC
MSLFPTARGCALAIVCLLATVPGCTSAARKAAVTPSAVMPSAAPPALADHEGRRGPAAEPREPRLTSPESTPIAAVLHEEDVPKIEGIPAAFDPDDPFAGDSELVLDRLVAEVHRRNPTLQASLAAWASAAERYPQVVALDDPMLQSMLAPGSFPSSSNVQPSYYVGIAQRIPWWGKRALRGQVAQAQTNAAALDTQEVQLRLTEVTRVAYFNYYLVARELELNHANTQATREFRATASSRYEQNLVTQQDVLQADVELAKLESRHIELRQEERLAIARINTLLHRVPDHTLPKSPPLLATTGAIPAAQELQDAALAQRPDLAAQAARIQAEQASVALACKEYYPDFEFMGRYDQFWTDVEQRPQVGMNVNVPLNQTRRKAAVREAMFRLSRMQAEYDQQVDNIRHDVEAGLARLEGSHQTVSLYESRILPAATANVESANAGYVAGTVDFLRLIEAQRELIELQEKHQIALADYQRRRAELERVVGAPLSDLAAPAVPPADLRPEALRLPSE